MVAYTDMEESLKTDVLEICTNACEKYINDNQSVSCWNALEYKLQFYHVPKHLCHFLGCPDDQRNSGYRDVHILDIYVQGCTTLCGEREKHPLQRPQQAFL